MTNVTAKHGQAAVHIGGHEMANGRWSPACGTQHHNVGGREVTPLRPTDKAVTCKRCLKLNKQETELTTASAFEGAPPVRTHSDGSQTYGPYVKVAKTHPVGRKLAQDHGLNFF